MTNRPIMAGSWTASPNRAFKFRVEGELRTSTPAIVDDSPLLDGMQRRGRGGICAHYQPSDFHEASARRLLRTKPRIAVHLNANRDFAFREIHHLGLIARKPARMTVSNA